MGNCNANQTQLSPQEKEARRLQLHRSKGIDEKMAKDHGDDEEVNKLLLLGAGESGKSTLFKQMIQIYGKGFPTEERKTYISVIGNNIIQAMKTLIQQSRIYGSVGSEAADAARYVDHELKGDEEIDERVAGHLKILWKDKGILATYDQRSRYQLTDSAGYFFDRLDEVAKKNFIPDTQDLLRCRVRTTGILENEFVIDGNHFKMFDVGGQRNERKKWIHCFEGVTAVLFVAAISEYDQLLYEDDKTNRMIEALNLFEEICNSRWFRETSMILFLNKRDIMAEKLPKSPLNKYFPEYQGGDNLKLAIDFLRLQFEGKNRNKEKRIYTHVTCATDTTNVHAVFNAVKDIIIKRSLAAAGLV
jgi:GTPase SAR1 family protein